MKSPLLSIICEKDMASCQKSGGAITGASGCSGLGTAGVGLSGGALQTTLSAAGGSAFDGHGSDGFAGLGIGHDLGGRICL